MRDGVGINEGQRLVIFQHQFPISTQHRLAVHKRDERRLPGGRKFSNRPAVLLDAAVLRFRDATGDTVAPVGEGESTEDALAEAG